MNSKLTPRTTTGSFRFEGGESLVRMERTLNNLAALMQKLKHGLVKKNGANHHSQE